MSGADTYKEFDTTSIISKETVTIGKYNFRKRELFLACLALIALIGVIILAIVLAVEVGRRSSEGSPTNQAIAESQYQNNTTTQSTSVTSPSYCSSPICLKTAYYQKSIMNEDVNPCHNFFQFACGGYAGVFPRVAEQEDQTPFKQIQLENSQKLVYLLDIAPERDDESSYERKLRHFMKSCSNHFNKMLLRGQPFLMQVIKPLGGWFVLGTWNASSFNFREQLKNVHINFWTPAIFTIKTTTDTTDWNKQVIEMNYGGIGLNFQLYTNQQVTQVYKAYMKELAGFLVRDAGQDVDTAPIDVFVEDAFEVESAIAQAVNQSQAVSDPHQPDKRMTLGKLNQLMNNTIDLVDYFVTAFPQISIMFNTTTAVAVTRDVFFHNLGPILRNYTSSDEGARKLHNYFIWQLLNMYAADLSWDYVHSQRYMIYSLTGEMDDSSGYGYCFKMAQRGMKDALGAVFVKNYVNQKDKQEAKDILDHIREQLVNSIVDLSWMTEDNRAAAVNKITNSLIKIGNPDYMTDDKFMDSLYSMVSISEADFFGNVLNLNKVIRQRFSDLLAKPDSKTAWAYQVYYPMVEYDNPWHELIATAAVLQNPLFAHNGPTYYNYGGIGSLLATQLIHGVDEYGSYYKLDKSNVGTWWTNSTRQKYLEIKQCAIEAQNGHTMGPYMVYGTELSPDMKIISVYHSPELLAEASGLRLSYKAYKAKSTTNNDQVPVGLSNYSLDKLFFLSYAQANCYNTPELSLAANALLLYTPTGEYKVNLAVSQVKEFQEVFGCVSGDPLVPAKTCTLF